MTRHYSFRVCRLVRLLSMQRRQAGSGSLQGVTQGITDKSNRNSPTEMPAFILPEASKKEPSMGRKVQNKNRLNDSWVHNWWLDEKRLNNRLPTNFAINPPLATTRPAVEDSFKPLPQDQLEEAAQLVARLSIKKEQQQTRTLTDNLDCRLLKFNDFGLNFVQSNEMNPDAFVQVCLQLAFYRIQQASLRQFPTEQQNLACSSEAIALAKAVIDGGEEITGIEKLELLWNALIAQSEHATKPLESSKEVASWLGKTPQIFFNSQPHFILSTRRIEGSNDDYVTGYGLSANDGTSYGVSYFLQPKNISFGIASPNNERLALALERSLRDVENLFDSHFQPFTHFCG